MSAKAYCPVCGTRDVVYDDPGELYVHLRNHKEDMVATTLSNMAFDPYFHENKPGLTLDELAQKVYYLEQAVVSLVEERS